jgi:cytochrome P450
MEEPEIAAPSAPAARAQADDPCAGFNIKAMDTHRVVHAAFNWLSDYPQREYLMGFFRRFWPILRIPFAHLVIVFRDEDVREVLTHDQEFPVPWGGKMIELSGKKNFVLGMKEGTEYRRNYEQLAKAFRREDVSQYVVPLAAKAAADILRGKLRIDAMRDLLWAVPAQLCEDYYGIEIPDKVLFAEWTIAMSSYLFGSASDKVATSGQPLALAAADCFLRLIRGAIEKARQGHSPGIVLPRLIEMQKSDPELKDDVLEAHLLGMVTGFVPTNLLASGNMLWTLLRRKDFMQAAQTAAVAGDDDLLWRCLREALRFKNFSLGPFRMCGPGGYKLTAGRRRPKSLKAGIGILASTQSAMFDSRRVTKPKQFDSQRAAEDYLEFGYGQHWCIGAFIAAAQITQTLKPLLQKQGLRRAQGAAGKLQTITVFPAHLTVEFDA